MKLLRSTVGALAATVLLLAAATARSQDQQDQAARAVLMAERRALEFDLTRQRTSILQSDRDLKEVNERILKMQKLLADKLAAQPEIKFIQNKIDRIDKQLQTMSE